MSGLINQILQAGGGTAIDMIAGKFGISPSQSKAAIEALGPMISGGFKAQAQNQGGIESIIGNILNQNHANIGTNPEELARPGTTSMGNEILGAIFGSKEVSREVAGQAAAQTGLSADLLKKMLPVIATMAAGSLASKASAGGLGGSLGNILGNALTGGAASGAIGSLASMIDLDKDGNPLDDIMGMLAKK